LSDIFTTKSTPDVDDDDASRLVSTDTNDMHLTATDYAAAYSGAGSSCDKQAEMSEPAAYYKKRGDWISQNNVSIPDGPPETQDSCGKHSKPIDVHKPCIDLETRAQKLRPYPIDTEHNQPHYRSCHERPNKVQLAHDPSSYSYSPV
jgi:hypothetical protein